jgi:hypothetical protein
MENSFAPKSDSAHAIAEGGHTIRKLGGSKTVRNVRAFIEAQSEKAPLRTAAIAVGAGVVAALLLAGDRDKRRWFN